jgi:hypothetical protein
MFNDESASLPFFRENYAKKNQLNAKHRKSESAHHRWVEGWGGGGGAMTISLFTLRQFEASRANVPTQTRTYTRAQTRACAVRACKLGSSTRLPSRHNLRIVGCSYEAHVMWRHGNA